MSVFISDVDKVERSIQFQALICMNNTLSGRWVVAYESLNTEETLSSVIPPKSCRYRLLKQAVAYKSFSLQSLSHSSNGVSQI